MAGARPGTATAAATGDGYRYYAQIRSYLNVAAEGGVAGGSTASRARKGTWSSGWEYNTAQSMACCYLKLLQPSQSAVNPTVTCASWQLHVPAVCEQPFPSPSRSACNVRGQHQVLRPANACMYRRGLPSNRSITTLTFLLTKISTHSCERRRRRSQTPAWSLSFFFP